MKPIGSNYADSWKPEKPGDFVRGLVTGLIREVPVKQGRKTTERKVFEMMNADDNRRVGIWESATLIPLFEALADLGEDAIGTEVYIHFDGLGKAKPGQNPPKLFTVAMAE